MEIATMRAKDYLFVFLKGILLGLLSLGIPGVSASTVGLIVGIYFLMVEAISGIFKDFRKNVKFLLFLSFGYATGAVGAAFSVTILFKNFPVAVAFVIVGIIVGAIAVETVKLKGNFKKLSCWIVFFVVIVALGLYNFLLKRGDKLSFPDSPTIENLISMATIGFFTSSTFIIPGIDFAVVFLSLGIYYPFMNMLTEIFSFGAEEYLSTLIANLEILGFYVAGYMLGIFLISKIIKKLNDRYAVQMQFASYAFLVSAPVIFIENCLSSGVFQNAASPVETVIGAVLGVFGLAATAALGKYGKERAEKTSVSS